MFPVHTAKPILYPYILISPPSTDSTNEHPHIQYSLVKGDQFLDSHHVHPYRNVFSISLPCTV